MTSTYGPTTGSELALRALRCFPDGVAFRHGDRELTYRQAEDTLARTVTVLHDLGIGQGDGIGVLSPNRPEVWFGQVAPAFLGGRFTALHPLGSLDDHRYACDEAELKVVLVDPAYAERGADLFELCPSVEHVLTFGPSDAGRDLTALVEKADPTDLHRIAIDPESTSWVLYTGGTTGVPKAAELAERCMGQMVIGGSMGWDLPADRQYLVASPMTHAAGLLVIPTLLAGGTVTTLAGWDPHEWVENVIRHRITLGLLVPAMIYSLLDSGALDGADLSSLETIMYGASPMAPARLVEGIDRLGSVFCQLYGQTECAGIATSLWRHQHDPARPERFASCGQPIVGARLSLRDDDDQPVQVGQPGEVCVQGPAVMKGYFKRPDLTAETLAAGWLRTGDVGYQDDEGFVYLVDRKKDMIVSGGFNVFPSEIEKVLAEHPAVSAAAVIGVPDGKWGEAVKAIVVLRAGASVDATELTALVKDRKGGHHAPKSVDFVDAIPVTPVGKPDKKSLRAPFWEGHDRQVG